MDENRGATQVSWGARINTCMRNDAKDRPSWVKPVDRHRWVKRGLVVWQQETQHIIRLSAARALRFLDELRCDDAWTEQGIVVAEPVTRIRLKEPEPKPEQVLWNPIHLSPSQTTAVHRLLERNEGKLNEMREQEEKEVSEAWGRVFRLIMEFDRHSKDKLDTRKD